MNATTYKGHTIQMSNTTTDSHIIVFGKKVNCVKNVYKIDGKLTCCTSVKSAKEFINGGF